MKPGDIIKIKHNGFKQKFKVLGVHDIITKDCIHTQILYDWPMCYEQTLKYAERKGLNNLKFYPICDISANETVSDNHTHRIYLQKITMNIKIKEYSYHRNGVSGNGFYVIIFLHKPDDQEKEETFLATLFEEHGSCAVISLDRIKAYGISFAKGNSWRGDYFEDSLRKMIANEESKKDYLLR